MRDTEFNWFRAFLERKSGIVINENKKYLIQSRLRPLLQKYGISDLNRLIVDIKARELSDLAVSAIDAMTTNETLFFRDKYPYEALETLIFPEIIHAKPGSGSIHVWSAAASRGQEAYSIAMAASEAIPQASKRVRILGTDLSTEAIEYAKEASYSQIEVQRGMAIERLVRFFNEGDSGWKVSADLKSMVKFQTGNLTDDTLISQVRRYGPFNVVFLRNVLIYFTPDERRCVVDRIARAMVKGGYLITGAAEMALGNTSKWESVMFKGKRLWKLAA